MTDIELEAAKRHCCNEMLPGDVRRLIQQLVAGVERLRAALDTYKTEHDEVCAERAKYFLEAQRLRPVYEAALAWGRASGYLCSLCDSDARCTECKLWDTVKPHVDGARGGKP